MKDYSDLHDQQINILVCKALGLEMSGYARIMTLDDATVLLSDNKTLVDYCNNPANAWSIITANKISIYAMSENDRRGRWGAEAFHPNESYHFNDNPLRAAMIVFLMMQNH
ncbi:hypothetical protein LGFCKLCI_00067 [Klebsiella phage vB_KpnM_SCNJ1-Y]|nr:hypothetical protein LGFCKLCI_00067 [Klebsiella phage vB_KpnM_SCNJ1-Y]